MFEPDNILSSTSSAVLAWLINKLKLTNPDVIRIGCEKKLFNVVSNKCLRPLFQKYCCQSILVLLGHWCIMVCWRFRMYNTYIFISWEVIMNNCLSQKRFSQKSAIHRLITLSVFIFSINYSSLQYNISIVIWTDELFIHTLTLIYYADFRLYK